MLKSALGPAIAAWLEDTGVAEVMLNADGRLWVDRLDSGMAVTEEWLSPAQAERIIRLVAHHVGAEVHRGTTRVSAGLPRSGARFERLGPCQAGWTVRGGAGCTRRCQWAPRV